MISTLYSPLNADQLTRLLHKDIGAMEVAVKNQAQSRPRRARSAQDKEQKRERILQTAAELFNLDPSTLPTASSIANHAGIAKGTVYLYFKSKEEIFLALLDEHYANWYSDMSDAISQEKPSGDVIIEAICHYIDNKPDFFRLASLSSSIIEQNVDSGILQTSKTLLASHISTTAKLLAKKLGLQDESTCSQLLLRSYAMLLGIWQLSNPPEKVAVILSEAELNFIQPQFQHEAKEALTQLWQGYLEQANSKGKPFWKLGGLFG